jgi:hypothetical protein
MKPTFVNALKVGFLSSFYKRAFFQRIRAAQRMPRAADFEAVM